MKILVKLLTRGEHQFIPWPAKFPMNAKEVEIERKGDAFIVRPRRKSQQNMGD